jgi:hypothetical protein
MKPDDRANDNGLPLDESGAPADLPGLPGLRSWNAVYVTVVVVFVVWVGLLTLLMRRYQ